MVAIRRTTAIFVALALAGGLPILPASHAGATPDNTPWYLPTRPPRCSSKQIAAGAVASCVVAGNGEADSNGWPAPPFPNDPASDSEAGVVPLAGWSFSGWGYNGSAALAGWETLLAVNTTAIGPVRPNQLRALPDALPLFEGFLRDIVAGGYKITDAGTYSFRCTSGSGKSCSGLTRDSLSNHAWGLALDLNSGANPEANYVGVGGASACATPVKTDIPMWVVRAAERWGLYWGGYGWSGGCSSPNEVKATASRDSTHFEFRGSPAQARAIVAVNFGGACLEAADDAGVVGPRCLAAGDVPGAGWRVVINTKAPTGTAAALVNLTVTGALAAGYITAESCSAAPAGPRSSSNGNATPGQTVANLAVVPLDAAGRFCLYRSTPMHTIVDVQGYFAPAKSAGGEGTLFTAVGPQRVLDTRVQSFCGPDGGACAGTGPVAAGAEVAVAAASVPAGAVAILANLTVTEPVDAGYLTADSCAGLAAGPQTHSNANFAATDTVANLAVVPVAAGRTGAEFCTYSTAETQKVVDVQGYFAPPSNGGWGFTSMPTKRLVDTRGCWSQAATGGQRCNQINESGSVVTLTAPAGAAAVLVNLTLTEATAAGFATVQACTLVQGPAKESNGNVARGRTAANLAIVAVDPDGTFCVRVSAPMHVIVDVQGIFSPAGTLQFMPIAPMRRGDSRAPGG